MSTLEIICGFLLIIAAVAIIVLTLAQESKGRGLSGAIMGGNGSEMMAGRTKTNEAKMAQLTKIFGVAFAVIAVAVCLVSARLG